MKDLAHEISASYPWSQSFLLDVNNTLTSGVVNLSECVYREVVELHSHVLAQIKARPLFIAKPQFVRYMTCLVVKEGLHGSEAENSSHLNEFLRLVACATLVRSCFCFFSQCQPSSATKYIVANIVTGYSVLQERLPILEELAKSIGNGEFPTLTPPVLTEELIELWFHVSTMYVYCLHLLDDTVSSSYSIRINKQRNSDYIYLHSKRSSTKSRVF